jgi:hypothetical protein
MLLVCLVAVWWKCGPMRDGKNSIVLIPKPAKRRGAVGLLKLFSRCPFPIPPPERFSPSIQVSFYPN